MILALALPSFAQQTSQASDTRPRAYFETGPPSEFFSEADLQEQRNSFAEGFPSFCPGAVVTENRNKADYVVRLSLYGAVVEENVTLNYRMAIFQSNGDQLFAETVPARIDSPTTRDERNPEILLTGEACAVIAHHMDRDTVAMIASQAKRRQPRVFVKATLEGFNDERRLNSLATLIALAFSQTCFCISRTETGDEADYVIKVDMRHKPKADSLTVLDHAGGRIFSGAIGPRATQAQETDSLAGACRAILLRESAEVQEKPPSKQ